MTAKICLTSRNDLVLQQKIKERFQSDQDVHRRPSTLSITGPT